MDTFIIAPQGAGKTRAANRLARDWQKDIPIEICGKISLNPNQDVISVLARDKRLSVIIFEEVTTDKQLDLMQKLVKGYRELHGRKVLAIYCIQGEMQDYSVIRKDENNGSK